MDSFNGVTVNRTDGNLPLPLNGNDGTSLMIFGNGVAAVSLTLGAVAALRSLSDAVSLGLTASYDDTNSLLVNHHISEFFRLKPDGRLFILMLDGLLATNDAVIASAIRANRDIKLVAYIINEVADQAQDAQDLSAIADELKLDHIHTGAILVGAEANLATVLISAYADTRTEELPLVTTINSADPAIAGIKAAYSDYTALGTALGSLAARGVEENMGSVDINDKPAARRGDNSYSITDKAKGLWMDAQLVGGKKFADLTPGDRAALTEKGYVYAGSFGGFAGIYWSGSDTMDDGDYKYIERNRIWAKVADGIRLALLPRVRRNISVDPTTGNLANTEVIELEGLAGKPLQAMTAAGEISGFVVTINPAQSLVNNTPLKVSGSLTINGILFEFDFDLGLATSNTGS
jgi:hypothetical protein